MKKILFLCSTVLMMYGCSSKNREIGHTEITRWQYGKKGAVSVTYDDGSINQFRIGVPVMNRLNMPGTFFIITGQIPGSQYQGKYIGRPVREIITESASVPTNKDNFPERASAAGYLGFNGTRKYHTDAGIKMDAGKPEEAYKIIDELYEKVRNGEFQKENKIGKTGKEEKVTWDEIREYAAQGHEFASHTVTHRYLSALDDTNIIYELEKSRDDILKLLGRKHTFSSTVPYATRKKHVLELTYKVYPAVRTLIPEAFAGFMEDVTSTTPANPGTLNTEYIKWQCRAFSRTSLETMKSWIDTTAAKGNIWQILIYHGIDGIGYEPVKSEILDEYFRYIKSKESDLWIATFGDVTKYISERMNSEVTTSVKRENISVLLTHSLDKSLYDLPLTLKTYIPERWKQVQVKQDTASINVFPMHDDQGTYIIYQVNPDGKAVELSGIHIRSK